MLLSEIERQLVKAPLAAAAGQGRHTIGTNDDVWQWNWTYVQKRIGYLLLVLLLLLLLR